MLFLGESDVVNFACQLMLCCGLQMGNIFKAIRFGLVDACFKGVPLGLVFYCLGVQQIEVSV